MSLTSGRAGSAAARAAAIVAVLVLGACAGDRQPEPRAIVRGEPPAFEDVAARHNDRVSRLTGLFAPAVVRITYTNADCERQTDQGEGTLQIRCPDHLALSINKAGKRLFWFGCDSTRYWWFDLVDRKIATVGRHDAFDPRRTDLPGLSIRPQDVIRLLAILPIDADAPGGTQWSEDGRLLGVTTELPRGGFQRMWLDPDTLDPRKVELFTPGKDAEIVADLSEPRYVPITGDGTIGPRVASTIIAVHLDSGATIRLDLAEMTDGKRQIQPAAFDFEELKSTFQVERVIDADSSPARRGS